MIPASCQDEATGFYKPYELIVFLENHLTFLSFSEYRRLAPHNHIRLLYNENQQELRVQERPSFSSAHYLHCHHTAVEDDSSYTALNLQDCSHTSFQFSIVAGIVVLRDCDHVTLSICCNRLLVMSLPLPSITRSNCHHIALYTYTCTNPVFIACAPDTMLTAPYNTPRVQLLRRLREAHLTGRNCWDFGIDMKGVAFPCPKLPPEEFSPFLAKEITGEEELPLLPTEYEDVFRHVLNTLKKT